MVEQTFGKRLVLGHVSMIAVILLSTTTAFIALRSMTHQTERTSETDKRLTEIDQLRTNARELARSTRRYLLTGDGKEQQRVRETEAAMNKDREHLGPEFENRLDDYVATVVRTLTSERADPGAALARFEDDLVRVRGPLSVMFEQIVSRERAQLDAAQSSQRLARTAQWALAIAAALSVLVTIGSILVVLRALRRQAERVRRAEAVAEGAESSRKELLAASRELRAPLGAIIMHTTQLRAGPLDETQARVVQSIAKDASEVDGLLRELLDVTAVQTGTMSLRREPCDCAALVDEAIGKSREIASARGIRLQFEASRSLTVSADRERVARALSTLLGHTVASARTGGEIVVSALPADDGVRFAIVEVGMSAPAPGAVTAATDDLALLLSRRVIEAHGGRMGVEAAMASRTYWFTLPTEPRMLR